MITTKKNFLQELIYKKFLNFFHQLKKQEKNGKNEKSGFPSLPGSSSY